MTEAINKQSTAPRWPVTLAYVIGILIALSFLAGAWLLVEDNRHMTAVGVATDGTIVGRKEQRSRGRGAISGEQYVHYLPVFSYRTANGTPVEAASQHRMEPSDIHVGQAVRVIYDSGDITHVYLASFIEDGFGATPWLLGFFALLLGIPCLIQLWRRCRV